MRIGIYVVEMWAVISVSALLAAGLIAFPFVSYYRGRRTGLRKAHPDLYSSRREKSKDTALFMAALVPSVLVWLAVMGVSFIGLTGFARDVMGWDHWTNILVPLSLDGISVSFGAWAFVAVKRGRHPGRAYKIVLAAAAMSAMLNFVHGRETWSVWAGSYLAFLSFAGMAMFHELLEQFMATVDEDSLIRSTSAPAFGSRWLWAPWSTFLARRAWKVHPVPAGVRPSVLNALHHLSNVPTITGKLRKMTMVIYTEDQLAAFPDGLRTTSRKPAEDFREADSRNFPDANPGGGKPRRFGLPHLPMDYGKPNGTAPGNGRSSSRNGSPEVFREVSEADQVEYIYRELLRRDDAGEKGLTIDDTRRLLKCRFDAAKPILEKAKERRSNNTHSPVGG